MKETWEILGDNNSIYSSVTDIILDLRGINNKEQFLNPKETDMNSPWELSNMKIAVDKIINAIENNLKIGIYADIDADGVTSTTIMYKYLKDFDIQPTLIYHQRKENHGIKPDNVPNDLDLLIIVDSSSNSTEECQLLNESMDIVILDHHQFEKNNPYATIVNPQYNNYPNKHLSGAGVVFQTCKAIDEVMLTDFANKYIDIACVGLIGDMMDVTDPETRYIIYKGLLKIHNNCDKNLMAILKNLKKDYKPNATTIGFYLVPFINAIIRLGKIENIIEILTTDDDKNMKKMIKASSSKNEERKEIQKDILEEIENIVDLSHKIIIINVTELQLNKTLNGLVAQNVAQKYQKPTLIVSLDTEINLLVGSGRAYDNSFDFMQTILDTELFEHVGGHPGAFGVEFKPENIQEIYKAIDLKLENTIQDYKIKADLIIDTENITWDLAYEMQKLSFITGKGFKDPLFVIENLPIREVKTMKEVHIKFNAEDLECVKFNVQEKEIDEIKNAICVDVMGNIGVNSWYNFGTKQTIKSKQVLIRDIQIY